MANYDDNAFCIVSIFAIMLRKNTFAFFYSAKVKTTGSIAERACKFRLFPTTQNVKGRCEKSSQLR